MASKFCDRHPGTVEYIPYRKRDVEAVGDSITHGYFAGHGYACVRLDLRGAGKSEGVSRMNIWLWNKMTVCKSYSG